MHEIRVEHRSDGSTVYEVPPEHEPLFFQVPLDEGRTVDIEIPPNPPVRVMDGREFPQLDAPLVLVQFEVVAQDCRRGWFPLGGEHYDYEAYFGDSESALVFERAKGDVGVWTRGPGDLQLQRSGTFPVYVVTRAKRDSGVMKESVTRIQAEF